MSKQFFGGLSAGPQWPDLIMNEGPLPKAAGGQFSGIPDGEINERVSGLLNDVHPYVYGQAARMATQTQLAHPHRVQMAIPVLCVPAPKAEAGCTGDPKLEHVFCDGDLAFTVNMPQDMLHATSQYCLLPFGVGDAYAPLINLSTVNYLLWGLQVGRLQPNGARWERFFTHLCRGQYKPGGDNYAKEDIFYFLQTFIRPFGVMHGSEKQGGAARGEAVRGDIPRGLRVLVCGAGQAAQGEQPVAEPPRGLGLPSGAGAGADLGESAVHRL